MSISYLWKLSQFPEKVECAIHFRRSAGSFIGIEKCDTSQLAGKYSWEYIFFPLPKENDHLVAFFPPPRLVFGEYRAKSITSACRQLWCFCQSKKIADTRGIFHDLLFSRWFCRTLPSEWKMGNLTIGENLAFSSNLLNSGWNIAKGTTDTRVGCFHQGFILQVDQNPAWKYWSNFSLKVTTKLQLQILTKLSPTCSWASIQSNTNKV